MNKSAIKNFAVTARIKLMEAVEQKAYELGISRNEVKDPEVYQEGFHINGKFFKKYQMKQRDKLLQKINDQGFDQVVEEVAYTWFNRFIAIRFMEVNEYLPTGVRVLSSTESGKIEPDAVTEVLTIVEDLDLDLKVVYRLQDENDIEELFKYILVKQCNKLGEIMPMMFEQIENYTELLLPNNLLSESSVVRDLVKMIDETDWNNQVEIIGSLYQEYISEKKAEVDRYVKNGKKVSKEDLAAKTQLFTPKWIVKYMLENSLGKLWIQGNERQDFYKDMNYYVSNESLDSLSSSGEVSINPEEIKVLDPCVGSGHILVSAFDLLFKIYQSVGYSNNDIPKLILEKNLYGLEIDERAVQLTYFALFMKARSYSRKIFKQNIEPNIYAVQESSGLSKDVIDFIRDNTNCFEEITCLLKQFKNAKQFGSLIKIENRIDFHLLINEIQKLLDKNSNDIFTDSYKDTIKERILPLIHQAQIMDQKYDVVITNPPYLGRRNMNTSLTDFIDKYYPNSKMELYAVFIEACIYYTKENSYFSMVTRDSWMFTGSFKDLRVNILSNYTIDSMLHLGPYAFEEIKGEVVTTTSFSIKTAQPSNYMGVYYRLVDIKNANEKKIFFLNNKVNYIKINQEDFQNIEGWPLSYWIEKEDMDCFSNSKTLSSIAPPKKGLDSNGESEQYFRKWYEVEFSKIYLNSLDDKEEYKWFEIDMGGDYRKWYGNRTEIINYENNGQLLKNKKKKANIRNENYYFKKSLTYGVISSQNVSFRVSYDNSLFYQHGANCFPEDEIYYFILALGNSKVTNRLLTYIAPTLTFTVGDVAKLPVLLPEQEMNNYISDLVKNNVSISKEEWDSFEIAWEFKKHPILNSDCNLISDAFNKWVERTNAWLVALKKNETKINEFLIKTYGLEDKLNSAIGDDEVTIRTANLIREVKSFLSYYIGCAFGRYSLDRDGLAYTGGILDTSTYKTYRVDSDNIIPLTDDEYFENDIVSRFIDFVRVTFGQDTLERNLDFIADVLTKKANETSRQRIRRYFTKEFYKDHLQTYQKRPIYWLFDSGKNDGFKALIYIHRYDGGTVAKVRTDYLHTLQRKYEAEMSRLDLVLESDVATQEKTKAKKQKEKLQKQWLECQQYDQIIAHVANQKIEIDLDDGVKVNYEKFQNIDVPQGEGKPSLKANLLAKI